MLILTRKPGGAVYIGRAREVTVRLEQADPHQVVLGVERDGESHLHSMAWGVTLRLDDQVTVTPLSLQYSTARLGFDAPKSVPIARDDMKKGVAA